MPRQKDLKRLVRSRMRKTGEAYTTARAQVIAKDSSAGKDRASVRVYFWDRGDSGGQAKSQVSIELGRMRK